MFFSLIKNTWLFDMAASELQNKKKQITSIMICLGVMERTITIFVGPEF